MVNNGNGTITFKMTDGTSYTTANLTGPQGAQGLQGPQGLKGDTGAQGIQGPAGPSMIVAMGTIGSTGNILIGHNVTNCVYDSYAQQYVITLKDIHYSTDEYVTLVSVEDPDNVIADDYTIAHYSSGGQLIVKVETPDFVYYRGFSFVVLEVE